MDDKMVWFLSKEELEKMQRFANMGDYSTFRLCGILIIVSQIIMFLFRTIENSNSMSSIIYRGLYLYLILITLVSVRLLDRLRKNENNTALFYFVVKGYVLLVEIWAAAITCLGCLNGNDTSTFAYTVLACAAIIPIQPIIATAITVFCTVLINIAFIVIPGISFYPGMMLQTIAACVIAIVVSVSSFTMRVKRNRLIFNQDEHLKEIESLNARLKEDAEKDGLTGLYNRHFLTRHIDQKLKVGDAPSAVIMMDIDYFKSINDSYGHQNGDECLRVIAEETINSINHRAGYAVRYGGEEFLVFFESIKKEELVELAEELRVRVENLKIELNTHTHISCTVSVGYSCATEGLLYSELINEADMNLYQAKETGRNRVCGL